MPATRRFVLPKRAKRVPRFKQPDGLRMAYYASLRAYARACVASARSALNSIIGPRADTINASQRIDASPKRAELALEAASKRVTAEWPNRKLAVIAEKFGEKTSKYQKTSLIAQARASVSVDLTKVLAEEPGIAEALTGFVSENVSLIRSIQTRYFSEVEEQISAAVADGVRAGDLADIILEITGERGDVAESNALRIANDQIGKLTGQLNEIRQTNLGITQFIWSSSHDSRVRPEHQEYDGQTYDWDDPPDGEVPGEPINCRCFATPLFSELDTEDLPSADDEE